MLNLERIRTIADSYSAQEMFAALVWQRQFNEFNGKEIITDLSQHSHLWRSFLFSKPIYAPDEKGLSFCGVLDTLLAMANYRPLPEDSMIQFIRYPADTLYVLAENSDTIIAQLVEFGKKWQADSVNICDGTNEVEWKFQKYVAVRLKGALWGEQLGELEDDVDAVIISYWWD